MTNRMLIIVPTRSRPENVAKVVRAWEDTDAFRHADLCFAIDHDDLCFAIDHDDPRHLGYVEALHLVRRDTIRQYSLPQWKPLVPKLNQGAAIYAEFFPYFAIGFAGDDHLPRTPGWAARYLDKLEMMGTGVVSCPDGYRRDDLPTQWAMTADIVRALGRMVPAPVDHLYCDNAVRDLAKAAGCYAYLHDVLIEHMHPAAKKVAWDDQYQHVNRKEQFATDRARYKAWCAGDAGNGLGFDAELVRGLRSGATAPDSTGVPSGAPVCEHGYQLSPRSIEIGIPVHMGSGKLCGAGSPNIAATEQASGDSGS